MGAFTTRYGLYKPGGGSTGTILPDEVADIDKLTADLDQIDAALGIPVVTSVTLPGAPVDGQAVIESDTKKIKVFDDGPDVWITAELGRGSQTIYNTANLGTLDAIADATIGDICYMTTPGTGIDALKWEAYAGVGGTIDWRIIDVVVADTKVNLDNFITAVAAIADTRFKVGNLAFVTTGLVQYRFTTTAGVYVSALPGIVATRSTTTNVTTGGGLIPFEAASHQNGLTWAVGLPTRLVAGSAMLVAVESDHIAINSAANASIEVRKNGVLVPGSGRTVANVAGVSSFDNYSILVEVAAADYLEIFAIITGATPQPWAAANKVSAVVRAYR